jgi:hypothetical protein
MSHCFLGRKKALQSPSPSFSEMKERLRDLLCFECFMIVMSCKKVARHLAQADFTSMMMFTSIFKSDPLCLYLKQSMTYDLLLITTVSNFTK